MMDKKTLRTIYLKKRINIDIKEKQTLETKIFILFQKLVFDFKINYFLSYRAIEEKNEIDISLIENHIISQFPKVEKCYPVMHLVNNELQIMGVNKDTVFSKNNWNIEEPTNGIWVDKKYLDIILTPLLIFDENGFRVGYGKGMYDTLFSMCKKEVYKIGFCLFAPTQKIDDIQSHDVPLDIIITPERIFRFKV